MADGNATLPVPLPDSTLPFPHLLHETCLLIHPQGIRDALAMADTKVPTVLVCGALVPEVPDTTKRVNQVRGYGIAHLPNHTECMAENFI